MKRIYKPIHLWEEIKFNMWGEIDDRKAWLAKAIEFTSNHKLYGKYMMKVIEQWPNSCENSLTDLSINRKAWIGHAAVAFALECPEDIVREAWGYLTNEQRFLANKEADRAISTWENNRRQSECIRYNMDEQMLFEWHT